MKTWLREWTFPDRFIAWRRAALARGLAIVERERIDLILASFPPASVADLGLRLHESSKRPLVLDFRDRWLGPGGYEPASERGRRKHLELERQCIASATTITTVSDAMADAIAAEQKYSRERIFVVPNGFEEGEPIRFRRSAEAPAAALTIAHIGTVIPRNRPDLFFQSVAELHRLGALTGVMFEFVGNLSRDYLASIGVADIVGSTGLVSREEARRRMRRLMHCCCSRASMSGAGDTTPRSSSTSAAGGPFCVLRSDRGRTIGDCSKSLPPSDLLLHCWGMRPA
jgi:hypothetical protein